MTFDEWWDTRALGDPTAPLPLMRKAIREECQLAWETSRKYVKSSRVPEIRNNQDGSLDEVCADNCQYHLEQMSATHWWMEIMAGEKSIHVNLHSKATIKANVSDESRPQPSEE